MTKLEYKQLGQILNESGAKGVQWKGWTGNSQLILSQEYAPKVFVEAVFSELLIDIEIGNLQSLDKIAWRLREILGDSQVKEQSTENVGIKPTDNIPTEVAEHCPCVSLKSVSVKAGRHRDNSVLLDISTKEDKQNGVKQA